jgi:hypothetical protein
MLKLVLFEAIPAYAIHGKRIFPETARWCARRRFEMGKKPNLDSWGTESIEKKGSCMPKLTAK